MCLCVVFAFGPFDVIPPCVSSPLVAGPVDPAAASSGDGDGATEIPADQRVEALYVLSCMLDGAYVDAAGVQAVCVAEGIVPLLADLCAVSGERVQAWVCVVLSKLCDGCDGAVDAVLTHGQRVAPQQQHHDDGHVQGHGHSGQQHQSVGVEVWL